MNEHPILFSGEMVRAILDGRKTMTRRVLNPQPCVDWVQGTTPWCYDKGGIDPHVIRHPYGVPGDRLWVRETWAPCHCDGSECPETALCRNNWAQVCYAATHEGPDPRRWRPSIFMHRWDARIILEVTAIKVERVQGISEEDAKAEGVGSGFRMNAGWPDYQQIRNGICEHTHDTAKMSFASLWDSINAKRGYPWALNPWVWCISFRRVNP